MLSTIAAILIVLWIITFGISDLVMGNIFHIFLLLATILLLLCIVKREGAWPTIHMH